MKKLAALAIAGSLIVGMSACSAPALKSKDMSVDLKASATDDVLVGDPVTLTANRKLLHGRTGKVTLTVQSSPDGKTWTTVKKQTSSSKSKAVSVVIDTKTASDLTYRAAVRLATEGTKAGVASDPIKLSVLDLKAMVRKFYYDRTQAYNTSTEAGIAWDVANNYPGAFDMSSAAWAEGIAPYIEAKATDTVVPNLDTLSPDPTWLLSATKCNAASTTPFPGRTFVVTVDGTTTYNGFSNAAKSDVHLTLLKGKLYDYIGYCGR